MKKILSVMLIFILSLFVFSTTDLLKAEATQDVTVFVHIHQFDGDYTNTGAAVWDGQNWSGWVAASATDAFGAVYSQTWTAAEINAVSDSIEVKPTRNINNDDNTLDGGLAANSNYLAPDSIEGKVFFDSTKLKDGTITELHLYYVEGALDFHVVEGTPVNGMFFNVYANPEVAADELIYDGWGLHTWNNGLPDVNWGDNPNQYVIEMELESAVGWIPARLGLIEVAPGNTGNAGFIAHKGDSKSCGSDMFFDTDDLLALTGMAQVVYYQHGTCEFAADYASFLEAVATEFEINSGNRIVEGTQITAPDTLEFSMLMGRKPEDLPADLFTIVDGAGNMIPIVEIMYPVQTFGSYDSAVELRTETHVIVFVETDLDASHVALVGNIQGWAPDNNPILTTGQDINGFDVFEFTTFEPTAEFKFLYDELDAFNWGDTELIASNIVVDLSAGGTIQVYFNDTDDTFAVVDGTPIDADIANFTYTSGVTCAVGENLFTLFLDTDLDHTKIGLVGSIQEANNWSPENAIAPTGETADGEVVFEVCLTGTNVEYKVLFDGDDNGLAWGDRELVQSNQVVDFGDGTVDGEIAHLINGPITVLGDYVPTLSASSTYRLTIYMQGDVDWSKVGIVGTVQANQWTPAEAITYKEMDQFGNAIFDIALDSKTEEYLVLYDFNGDGFNWDDKISGDDNIVVDLGEGATLVHYAEIYGVNTLGFNDSGWAAWYGDQWSGVTTSSATIMDEMLAVTVSWDSAPAATYATQIYQEGFAVENGKFYRISFDAKAGEAKDILVAFGDALDADPWFTDFVGKTTFNLTTEMMTYTLEFEMTQPTTADQGKLVFELATAVQTTVYIDNVMIEEIDALGGTAVADTDQVVNGDFFKEGYIMMFEEIGADIEDIVTTDVTLKVADGSFEYQGEYYVKFLDEYVLAEDPFSVGTDLFISEYGEPNGGNCKYLEIFNPTSAAIDLANYSIIRGSNGAVWADGVTLDLTGTVGSGETVVLYRAECLLETDDAQQFADPVFTVGTVGVWIETDVPNWNGDDSIGLFNGTTLIDVFGENGTDPGSSWPVGNGNLTDGITANSKLIRIPSVYMGSDDWSKNAKQWFVWADASDTPDEARNYATVGAHEFAPMVPAYIMSEQLPLVLSNDFVAADVVAEAGTYAIMPNHLQVEFVNADLPLDSLVLLNATGEEVAFASYTTMYGPDDYTAKTTCEAGEQQIFVHINLMDTEVTALTQLGIVGTINGWDVANSITASGMDDAGNYVFEVCLGADVTNGEFKIKVDTDSDGFTWDGVSDPEMTPGNVLFNVADGPHFYVEEGNSALNVSRIHQIKLSSANALDKTSSYTLQFTDESGFVVSIPVAMDKTAPVIQATIKPGVQLVFDGYGKSYSDFDFFDYFDILTFVDTRDGDLGFKVDKVFYPTLVGPQTIIISATDSWGNKATYTINITVVNNDTDAPTISGTTEVTFTEGDAAPDWASYVTYSDGTLTINTSQVDMDNEGTFFVIFTAEDAAGNKATHTLEVTIEAGEVEPEPEPEPEDTGCFGSLNIASTLIMTVLVLGGAAVLVVRKR